MLCSLHFKLRKNNILLIIKMVTFSESCFFIKSMFCQIGKSNDEIGIGGLDDLLSLN